MTDPFDNDEEIPEWYWRESGIDPAILTLPPVHRFKEQLERSEDERMDAFWRKAFELFFGADYAGSHRASGPSQAQRLGTDWVVSLHSNHVFRVETKCQTEDWTGILLETISVEREDDPQVKVGWMEQELMCEWFFYGSLPRSAVIVLPWVSLRQAWIKNRDVWRERARNRVVGPKDPLNGKPTVYRFPPPSKNVGYVTRSIVVPTVTVLNAINRLQVVRLPDDGDED